jgi:phage baseplate assembly protein W
MNAPMIQIGSDPAKLKAAMPDITKAILAILNTTAGDEVKKAALSALAQQFTVQNVSLSDCHFKGK